MVIGVVGLGYRDAPLEILSAVSLSDTDKLELYGRIRDELMMNAVILSTCNRVEVYFVSQNQDAVKTMREFFLGLYPGLALEEYLFWGEGRDALLHLFEVSCGLDSLVLGEDQILGQVKAAHEFALHNHFGDKALNKIFQAAVTTAKKLKTRLSISSIPLSLSYIGIKLLLEHGGIRGKRILVLGAGKMSRLAVQYLIENEADEIVICSRTMRERLEGIEDGRIRFEAFSRRYELLLETDIVISATSAPHTVLTARELPALARPLSVLDLALPLDVEPAVGELPLVTLYNMEGLKAISQENRGRRARLCGEAKREIGEDVDALLDDLALLRADPVIRGLSKRCDEVTRDTMEFLSGKLELSAREAAIIQKALETALKRLTKEPVLAIRKQRPEQFDDTLRAARYLFGLEEQKAAK